MEKFHAKLKSLSIFSLEFPFQNLKGWVNMWSSSKNDKQSVHYPYVNEILPVQLEI